MVAYESKSYKIDSHYVKREAPIEEIWFQMPRMQNKVSVHEILSDLIIKDTEFLSSPFIF